MKIKLISALVAFCCLQASVAQDATTPAKDNEKTHVTPSPNEKKLPKKWKSDARAVYDLLVAQMQHSGSDYAGSADTLIKFARSQKDELLYAKAFKALIQVGRYADAVELTTEWQKFANVNININKFHVLALVLNNEIDKASDEIDKAIKKVNSEGAGDDIANDPILRPYEQLLVSSWYQPTVQRMFARLYEDYPDSELTALAYAQLLRWQNEVDKAVAIIDKLRFDSPRDVALVETQSDIYRYAVRLEEAEKVWTDFLADYPNEPEYRFAYAQFLYDRYDFKRAIIELDKVNADTRDGNTKESINFLRMMAMVQLQQFDDAAKVFEDELSTTSAIARARLTLAEQLALQKQFERAKKYLSPLIEEKPDSENDNNGLALQASLLMGQILYQTATEQSLTAGDEWFDQLNKRFALSPEVLVQKQASALEAAGYLQNAYDRVNAFLKANPNQAGVRYTRCLLAVELGLETVAIEDFRTLYAKSPDDIDVQNALGYTLLDNQATIDEGEALVKKAVFYKPMSPAYIDSLGWVYYRRGQFTQALPFFRFSYANYLDGEVIAHYILALHHAGHPELAKQLYQLEMRYQPNVKKIQQYVKDILPLLEKKSS
ncbi:MAG: hypothetical protein CR957_00420 [Gammaproteobacteria bacterium]|nr:MAG: hypothetical protein CR957_00420 [Gammaproteobacteria bacterium]